MLVLISKTNLSGLMLKLELSTKAFTATRLEKKKRKGQKWGGEGGGKHSEKKQKTNILFTPFYIWHKPKMFSIQRCR